MKIILWPIIGLLAMLTGACGLMPVKHSPAVEERTLANGLKVIVQQDTRAPVVVSQIWYKVGAIDEPRGLTGISHVLEHMMFKGTKKVGPGEFSRIIAANGGRENAFTGQDYTAYFQQLEKSRLPISFELESDRMRNLLLREAEFKKEKQVVIEERRLRTEDNPQSLAYEKFMATAYHVHPYKDPVIGSMEDLRRLTLDDLKEWYRRYYAPNNATLVVVGDVEPDAVFALAEKYFGPVPASTIDARHIPSEPPQQAPRFSSVEARAELPYLIMGYHVPVLTGKSGEWEPYALVVLAGVLDGGNSARLARELVRGRQIAAEAGADYSPFGRAPTMLLFDGTPARGKSLADLESALREQVASLRDTPVSPEELRRVKAQVIASDVYGRDSVFYQAMRIGMLETVGLDHRMLDDYVARINAVTAKQVQQVARKYLVEDNLTRTELHPIAIGRGGAKRPQARGGVNVR